MKSARTIAARKAGLYGAARLAAGSLVRHRIPQRPAINPATISVAAKPVGAPTSG